MNNLFTRKQMLFFAAGCIVLTMGYVLLAQGPADNPLSLSVAPIFLICGYCVLIPAAIILKDDRQKKTKK